jgi:molybdate transport system substrate-binding protein
MEGTTMNASTLERARQSAMRAATGGPGGGFALCWSRGFLRSASASVLASVLATAAPLLAGPVAAAELKVLTAGAYKPVVQALLPEFEQRTGHRVVVDNDTAGALQKRVAGGETFDVLVLTPAPLEALGKAGTVVASSVQPLARVAIGVAVKQGATKPDLSSVDSFRQALLSARAVATIDPASGGSSGIYLWQLFERLGIAAQLKPKAVLVPGGLVAQRLVTGEADLAVHQISEILAVPGATLVGPLPAEIQNYTVYAGAVSASARDAAAAQAFLATLAGPRAAAVLKEKGMEAP